ncbi:alpha/beta hydrolase [Actinobacteria bacterium YIM 96077]|uniref:Alpha/beta hydrolase n=1 Tax=Phytoactinopolyspora halophila TaxID=1981511 RepID=A0A329QTG4_9ACTN|nr:alpha/beta hydrolase [Phytoactinopolyspora halophila]AYY13831.1 alpha/beta hydrolase [Actinobacteria bacterium YIM 96077]RAW15625.1 alpha/beta hydrolase [Phytoactinopolyspora halophila]
MISSAFPLQTLDLDDHRVAYVDLDPDTSHTPLVLLHGGVVDHRMWSHQLAAFPDRRVIAPDARGHGQTSTPTGPHRLCDDVVALLDALDVPHAVLVGLSMGGGTAVDTALEYPDRVTGLVVSGTGTSEPEFTDPWIVDIFSAWQQAQAAADLEAWVDVFLRFVPGPQRTAADVEPAVMRGIQTMARDLVTTHVKLDENGVPVAPAQPTPVTGTWSRLPGIAVPVLAIAGSADGSDHVRMTRQLAEHVQQGRFVTVDGVGHYPNLERPAEFNAAVLEFLAAHDL